MDNSYFKWTPEQRGRVLHGICIELPSLEAELRRLGLYATAAELNKAVQRLGYDIAEHEEREKGQ